MNNFEDPNLSHGSEPTNEPERIASTEASAPLPKLDLESKTSHELEIEYAPNRTVFTAHQGVQGFHVPNSRLAIKQAIGWAQAVEFDTFVAHRENGTPEVVVIHPEGYSFFVDPQAMPFGKPIPTVLPQSFEELRAVTVRGQQLVATLDEILDDYSARRARGGFPTELQIELKGPGTAEAVAAKILDRIAAGELAHGDVILCTFMYPEETRNRFEIIREISPDLRLGLTVRGGDFSADQFNSLDEVLAFVKQYDIELLDISRRNLTRQIVERCQNEGLHVACHHARTTDEIHASLALGVNSVRADFFQGPDASEYPPAPAVPEALFDSLHAIDFYKARDWIWEQAREIQPIVNQAINTAASDAMRVIPYRESVPGDDPVLLLDSLGARIVVPAEYGKNEQALMLHIGSLPVPPAYLSCFERQSATPVTYDDILPPSGTAATFWTIVKGVNNCSQQDNCELFTDLVFALDAQPVTRELLFGWSQLEQLASGNAAEVLQALQDSGVTLEPETLQALESLANEYLTRSGRLLGMLLYTATGPRQGDPDAVYLEGAIDSFLLNLPTVQRAVTEQFESQALRSGKIGTIENAFDLPEAARRIQAPVQNENGTALVQNPGTLEPLPHIPDCVLKHWNDVPFAPPHNPETQTLWFEGSFNPMGFNHAAMVKSMVLMGFGTIVVGIVPKNPHKDPRSILPLEHRYNMVRMILEAEGIPLVDSPNEQGVYITRSSQDFHEQRLQAWYKEDHHILMGPDNFETYLTENRAWTLFAAKNSAVKEGTRFQDLYETLLKERILVFDTHFNEHATHVRQGKIPPHPAIREYWEQQKLESLLP